MWSIIHVAVNFIVGAKVIGWIVPVHPELVAAYELAVTYNNGASVPLLVFAGLTRSTPQLRDDPGAYDRAVALIFSYVLLWNFTFWSLGVAHIERNAAKLKNRASVVNAEGHAASSTDSSREAPVSLATHVTVVDEEAMVEGGTLPRGMPLALQGNGGGRYDEEPVSSYRAPPPPDIKHATVRFAKAHLFASTIDTSFLSRARSVELLTMAGGVAWRVFRKAVLTPPVLGIIGGVVIGLSDGLHWLLFVPGGPLQPVGDVLALVGQPSVPCSNLILGGSLYHGLLDLWRIVQVC